MRVFVIFSIVFALSFSAKTEDVCGKPSIYSMNECETDTIKIYTFKFTDKVTHLLIPYSSYFDEE